MRMRARAPSQFVDVSIYLYTYMCIHDERRPNGGPTSAPDHRRTLPVASAFPTFPTHRAAAILIDSAISSGPDKHVRHCNDPFFFNFFPLEVIVRYRLIFLTFGRMRLGRLKTM